MDKFDLVHARFELEHLADPRAVMARLAGVLCPRGVLVVEDSAGLALDITPSVPILDHFVSVWERAGRSVGWDANYGRVLIADLRTIGLLRFPARSQAYYERAQEQTLAVVFGQLA